MLNGCTSCVPFEVPKMKKKLNLVSKTDKKVIQCIRLLI
jgi:hypothetical protein